MISATLYQGENGLTGFTAAGHSGWAESGEDLICAAVSVLTCNCVNSLESVCGVIPVITREDPEQGILAFKLPERSAEENEKAQILMGALKQGMRDLADSYPEYVRLMIQKTSQK